MRVLSSNVRTLCLGAALMSILAGAVLAQEPAPQTTAPENQPVSVIKEITYQKVDIADQLQVMIKVEGPFLIETFELIAPKRLVIDFSPVSAIEALPVYQVNEAGLLNIRTGQFQPTVARIVFDLDARIPSHSITTLPGGVKVVFWQEAAVEPEPKPEEKPEEQPELKPGVKPVGPGGARPAFIIRAGFGLTPFLKPSFTAQSEFALYGETASLTETFDQQVSLLFDLCLGRRINPKFYAGLGVSFQFLNVLPSLEASLPHPFLFDEYRDVAFTAEDISANMYVVDPEGLTDPLSVTKLASKMWTIYAFGLYSLFQNERLDISAGPVLGFSFGKLFSLESFELSEQAPFESEDVSLSSASFLENSFFKIDPGLLVAGTYSLNKNLSLFLTLKLHYVDVMVEELERRTSLFRLNALLGPQAGF